MDDPRGPVLPSQRRRGASDLLARLVGLASGAARATRTYAFVAAIAAVVIGVYVFRDGVPDPTDELALRLVVCAIAAAPPLLLFLFAATLKALAELPERVRSIPREAGERAEELQRLGERARAAQTRRGLRQLPLTLWQLVRVGRSSRELLTPYAGVVPLLRLPFLAWTLAAAALAAVEIAVAAVLLLLLLGA
jgi:hypothetical protein